MMLYKLQVFVSHTVRVQVAQIPCFLQTETFSQCDDIRVSGMSFTIPAHIPRHSSSNSSKVGPGVRMQIWLYKDEAQVMKICRVEILPRFSTFVDAALILVHVGLIFREYSHPEFSATFLSRF